MLVVAEEVLLELFLNLCFDFDGLGALAIPNALLHEFLLEVGGVFGLLGPFLCDFAEAVVEEGGDLHLVVLDVLVGDVSALGQQLVEPFEGGEDCFEEVVVPLAQGDHCTLILLRHKSEVEIFLVELLDR